MSSLWILIVGLVLALIVGFLAVQIPSGARAERLAENSANLTNAHVVSRGYSWGVLGGCHSDDVTKFTIEGVRNGKTVRVQVCAPIIGGMTVRG